MARLSMSEVAFSLLAFGLVTGCQQSRPAEQEQAGLTASDELLLASAKVALPAPGTTPADLPDPDSQGAQLVVQYCASCHGLPSPGAHSATDWPRYVRRMWVRTEGLPDRFEIAVPSRGERQVILEYLAANALQVGTDLPAGPGRDLFVQTCEGCHELPDPKSHSPDDWTALVRRMMDHMQDVLGQTLTPDQYSQVAMYLESASRR
jgi:cytochrome c5